MVSFFKVLDQQKKGYLEPEELTRYLTQEGNKSVKECFMNSFSISKMAVISNQM